MMKSCTRSNRPLAAVVILCTFAATAAPATGPRKKLIEVGWDMVDTAFLREHLTEMEAAGSFDGLLIWARGKRADGKPATTQSGWDAAAWERASFQRAVDDLNACRFTQFTDIFVRFNCTPGTLDWADDAGWRALAEKAGILAWVCKAGGIRGICLDPESYGEKQFQYRWPARWSFAKAAELARRRGAQVMQAIAAEHPSMTLMSFWLASLCMHAGNAADPDDVLITETYGLWPAFLNGMLDAVPSSMVLVDGNEGGYYIEGATYYAVANDMRNLTGPAFALIAPPNQAKYRAQMQVGFGFYLDMYINPEGNKYYRGPGPGGTRLDRLRDNLAAAVNASDQYVWVYGEQCRWWPSFEFTGWGKERVMQGAGKGGLWEEALPGLTKALAQVRDPDAAARAEIAARHKQGSLGNLARNGDFSAKAGELPAEWGTWQDTEAGSEGKFSWDAEKAGCGRMENVKNGCFIQKHTAEPGQRYFVEASVRSEGAVVPSVMVRWQTTEGAWVRWDCDATFTFAAPAEYGWRKASGAVMVPEDVGQIVILLRGRSLAGRGDVCWFDDLALYRLDAAGGVTP